MLEPRDYWEARYRLAARQDQTTPTSPSAESPTSPTPFGERASGWVRELQDALGRPGEVLELGSGTGRDTRALWAAGARVTALDVSPTALSCLEELTGVLRVDADLREPLPFAASAFDVVYSHFVLSCAFQDSEIEALVGEIERVLRPEGELWLCVRSTDDPIYRMGAQRGAGFHALGETGLHFFSRRSLRRFLARFDALELRALQVEIEGEPYGALEVRARRPGLGGTGTP